MINANDVINASIFINNKLRQTVKGLSYILVLRIGKAGAWMYNYTRLDHSNKMLAFLSLRDRLKFCEKEQKENKTTIFRRKRKRKYYALLEQSFLTNFRFNCVNVTRSHNTISDFTNLVPPLPNGAFCFARKSNHWFWEKGGLNFFSLFFSVQDGKKAVIQAFTLQIQTATFTKRMRAMADESLVEIF